MNTLSNAPHSRGVFRFGRRHHQARPCPHGARSTSLWRSQSRGSVHPTGTACADKPLSTASPSARRDHGVVVAIRQGFQSSCCTRGLDHIETVDLQHRANHGAHVILVVDRRSQEPDPSAAPQIVCPGFQRGNGSWIESTGVIQLVGKVAVTALGLSSPCQNRDIARPEPDLECWPSLGMPVKTRVPASPTASGLSANSVICNSRLIPRISKRRQGRAAFGAGWQKGGDEDR